MPGAVLEVRNNLTKKDKKGITKDTPPWVINHEHILSALRAYPVSFVVKNTCKTAPQFLILPYGLLSE